MKQLQATDERLSYRLDTDTWKFEFGDEADTVAYTKTFAEMERLVDWAERNIRFGALNDFDGGLRS